MAAIWLGGFAAMMILSLSNYATGQAMPASTPVQEPAATVKPVEQTPAEKLKRWFEIDALALSTRYRLIRDASDQTVGNAAQFQVIGRARFKFDKKGKYSINLGLFTGDSITGGWNNTGWGTGDAKTNLYLKQLYFDAKPVNGLEIQVGGIGFNNGLHTEITGYDNDAYLTGERVSVRLPKKAYFDEISVTNGYLGDLKAPSVFGRLKHLDKSNYHQFLVRKVLNKHVSFSADYTFEGGRDFLRQAVKFKIPESHILDTVLFENYQRLDPNPGYGFSLYGEKAVHKKLVLGAGFARIDGPMFNADRFPPGNRFYATATWTLTREFSVTPFFIQAIGDLPSPTSQRTRFDLIFTFNILETLRRYKLH